jgi:hypothetical protein
LKKYDNSLFREIAKKEENIYNFLIKRTMNQTQNKKQLFWVDFKKLIHVLLFVNIFLFSLSWFLKEELPLVDEILPELSQDPVQTQTTRKPFSFSYKETEYQVIPLYDYELWGLVASYNDIRSWFDSYHDADSVDTKDICVIWGKNLKTNDFRDWDIKNTSWTCWFSYDDRSTFFYNQLSNNHLITDNETIRSKINAVQKGSQIHLKGSLVSYAKKGIYDVYCSEGKECRYARNSSITREDMGNQACEVVFVDSLDVLKESTPLLSRLFWISKNLLFLFLVIRFFAFLYDISPIQKRKTQLISTQFPQVSDQYSITLLKKE